MRLPVIKAGAIFFFFSLFQTSVFSQRKIRGDVEYGLNVGMMVYQGDLSNSQFGSFRTQKLFFDLNATKLFGDNFSARLNLAVGKLKGDDTKYDKPDYMKHRAFNFTTPVYEISARLLWDPFGNNYGISGFTPYIFGGAGISFLNIKRDWSQLDKDYFSITSDVLINFSADSAHALPSTIPVFPLGGGIKYFLSPKLALNAEVSYRFTTTDYLDGFSRTANPGYRDSYLTYSVGVIYRPGNRDPLECPRPKY